MKRFVSPIILIVGLLMVGFPGTAMAQQATSAVTVHVNEYIAITPTPLDTMAITVTTPGTEAMGTSGFNVNANVLTNINVTTVVTPSGLTTGTLTATVNPTSTISLGSTSVVLTGYITVLLSSAAGTYPGGSITVTVTKI